MNRHASVFLISAAMALAACSSSSSTSATTGTSGSRGPSSSGTSTAGAAGATSNGTSTGSVGATSSGSSTGGTTGGAAATSGGSSTGAASNLIAWIPDYYGQVVRVLAGTSTNPITLSLPSTCTPNSVVVNAGQLYIACSAGTGAAGATNDEILVYDPTSTSTIVAATPGTDVTTTPPDKTITDSNFNSLIGMTFDSSGDLWIASYGNNEVLEITAASLSSDTPASTVNLLDSPSSPVALAFDTDGSLWVTGQFLGGILLNFTADQQNKGASASPRYCMVETGGDQPGCQEATFLGAEGLALFNGDIWVSNNDTGSGGETPGREIFDIRVVNSQLSLIATYGSSSTASLSPVVCPGGLFASALHLWVNDESYGESSPHCGAEGDVTGATGAVFDFTLAQLGMLATQAPAYTNVTGRPGFGGIFVQNDN